ncbi:MAG: hypothetical protein JNK53_09160 [Phycisphaerae bacterium]|nr:hypothetical protein [Phycisphaerae bacterium]
MPIVDAWTQPMIGQAATMSLLARHSILAQTTGARRPLLKLLPPMIVADSDVEWIARSCGDVCRQLQAGEFYGALGRAASNVIRSSMHLP